MTLPFEEPIEKRIADYKAWLLMLGSMGQNMPEDREAALAFLEEHETELTDSTPYSTYHTLTAAIGSDEAWDKVKDTNLVPHKNLYVAMHGSNYSRQAEQGWQVIRVYSIDGDATIYIHFHYLTGGGLDADHGNTQTMTIQVWADKVAKEKIKPVAYAARGCTDEDAERIMAVLPFIPMEEQNESGYVRYPIHRRMLGKLRTATRKGQKIK